MIFITWIIIHLKRLTPLVFKVAQLLSYDGISNMLFFLIRPLQTYNAVFTKYLRSFFLI